MVSLRRDYSLWIAWTAHNDLHSYLRGKVQSWIKFCCTTTLVLANIVNMARLANIAAPAEFSGLGTNRFPPFKPIKHVNDKYWHNRRIFRTWRQQISTFSIPFKRYARSFVQYVLNRVISSNEVLKVSLNVGRKSTTATEITFLIIYYYLLKISLLKNLGLKT